MLIFLQSRTIDGLEYRTGSYFPSTIIEDGEPVRLVNHFPQAGQNIVGVIMLLRNMPEPLNP